MFELLGLGLVAVIAGIAYLYYIKKDKRTVTTVNYVKENVKQVKP